MCVRDFSRGAAGQPVLICAPYTLHSALMTDFAPGHSLVETLRQAGLARIYVTDWRSAVSEMRYLSIDSFLADLNVAIDGIGAPVDLVGLCQGGWLSLIYAARFPDKVRRLEELRAEGLNLIASYADKPGSLGKIGTILGNEGIDIQAAALSQDSEGPGATLLLRVNTDVPEATRAAIRDAVEATTLELVDLS